MNTKNISISIAVIVIVVVAGIAYMQSRDNNMPATSLQETASSSTPETTGTSASSTTETTAPSYTAAEVATHKDATSCWTIIDGTVYDLTQWIPQHPGGKQAIIGLCGHDGSAAFHGQHDDAKKQADILATFKIGALTQ